MRISPFASSLFSLHVCGVCLHEIATKRHRPQRGNCTLKSLRARIVRTYWWILAGVVLLGPRATGVPQIEGRLLSGTGCWDVESVRLLERKLVFIFYSLPIPPSSNTLCHADFVWITQLEYIVMVIYFRRRDRPLTLVITGVTKDTLKTDRVVCFDFAGKKNIGKLRLLTFSSKGVLEKNKLNQKHNLDGQKFKKERLVLFLFLLLIFR